MHIGITLLETILSFLLGIFRQSSVIHSAVVFQAAVGDLRALSGTAQQPSEIRSGSSVYCLVGTGINTIIIALESLWQYSDPSSAFTPPFIR